MKAWQRYVRALGALFSFVAATEAGAQAITQTLRPGQTAGPRFLVPVFRSTDKALGVQTADEIRNRLIGDYMAKDLLIVPKSDIEITLDASGYPKTEALTPNDLKQLAPQVRAEEYIDGTITKDASGNLTLKATLNLVRPDGMVQPLPDMSDSKIGGIAKQFAGELEKARKQIPFTRQCLQLGQAGKFSEAVAAAQRGIAAYSRAAFPRGCMLEVAVRANFGADSIIKFGEEVLTLAPDNKRALQLLIDAYSEKKNDEKSVEKMLKLLSVDPSNSQLIDKVVLVLGRMGKPEMAKPIIDEAVKQNPGDPALVYDQWLIYRAMKSWKEAATIGEEMIKIDTTRADTTFFKQLVGTYLSDSNTTKALEAAARGANRFPKNMFAWLTVAQLARQAGQLPQALEATKHILEIDPKSASATLQRAQIYREMNQNDSVIATLRMGLSSGALSSAEDKSTAGGMALQIGNAMFQTFSKDSSHTFEQGEQVVAVLAWSDSLGGSDAAKFLQGATKLTQAQMLITSAADVARNKSASASDKAKACEDTKRGQNMLIDAGTLIQKGGKAFPQQAAGAMQGQGQLSGYADQVMKVVCKK